jgi:hypothetical protein
MSRERAVARQEPAVPKGVLAGVRRRAHEDRHRAWLERLKPLERLSEQARTQQQRLLDAASPSALNACVKAWLQRDVPELLERVQSFEREPSLQPSRGQELGRDFDLER